MLMPWLHIIIPSCWHLMMRLCCCARSPMPTIATAAVFCHQFYATLSMRTNDCWVRVLTKANPRSDT